MESRLFYLLSVSKSLFFIFKEVSETIDRGTVSGVSWRSFVLDERNSVWDHDRCVPFPHDKQEVDEGFKFIWRDNSGLSRINTSLFVFWRFTDVTWNRCYSSRSRFFAKCFLESQRYGERTQILPVLTFLKDLKTPVFTLLCPHLL